MNNLWPSNFQENRKLSAKDLLEEQARALPSLTDNLVWAEISPIEGHLVPMFLGNDFVYRFELFGKALPHYKFTVFSFSHDITFYPVKFILDEQIGLEIGLPKGAIPTPVSINFPEDLKNFAAQILGSRRLGEVIGSIMRLSR